MKLISLNDVTAGYDDKIVLQHVNFTVNSNDFIGVIGPNGGGKTTLIRLILGQIKPLKGKINYYDDILSHIGYLPQNHSLDRQFPISIEEVVISGLQSTKKAWSLYHQADRSKVNELLEKCGITHIARKNIGAVSGGELQRALLCRALISNPRLLVLDEPNTYVDNKFEKELYELLKEINNRMAIIMVSHDLGTITSYVKSIACVNRGLHYHNSNKISQEQLYSYDCPISLVAHGEVPHTVLDKHNP